MARLKRVVIPDFPHHVTQRGVRSMDIFYTHEDYKIYLDILEEQSKKFGLEVLAYCLMTNHVHIIAIPKDKTSLAKAIGETHRLYTRKINFEQGVKGYLFQGRFFSSPMDESYFYNCLKYVEQNPIRAKMVEHVKEYKYSSARYRLGLETSDLLACNEWIDSIGDYEKFIGYEFKDIDKLREKTRTGRPYASDEFYEFVKKEYGQDLKPKKSGPKVK